VTAADMTVSAIAQWYGAKRRMAWRIVQELGQHSAYFEGCAGGMSVILSKPPAAMENVCDLHRDVTNLAWVIQSPSLGPRFYRALRRTMLCEATMECARAIITDTQCPDAPDLDRAYWYFVFSWMGRGGISGTDNYTTGFCARWIGGGGNGARRFSSAVESIPAWRRRLRHVTVLRRNCLDFLADIQDAPGTAIYCDPPYLVKGARYLHDFKRDAPGDPDPLVAQYGDHGRMARLLARFQAARVVVSYYDDPALADLYPPPAWTHVHVPMAKLLANSLSPDSDRLANEVLIVNGPSFTQAIASPTLFGEEAVG
jgi:DNA adenine methylase